MAVSAAILEIFNVKEWPDPEIWVWGPYARNNNSNIIGRYGAGHPADVPRRLKGLIAV